MPLNWRAFLTRRTFLLSSLRASIGLVAAACVGPFTSSKSGIPPVREELRIALTDLGTQALDPILGPDNNLSYLNLLYDGVVGVDRKAFDLSKSAGIAEDWTVSSDSKVFTFKLRPWKFHNGDDVTAADVKFSLERLGGPGDVSPNGRQLKNQIDAITVNGSDEIEVRLKQSSPMFLLGLFNEMTDVSSLVLPQRYFESVGPDKFAQEPIGSGPYKLVQRKIGNSMQFEAAYPEHFAIGKPRFKRITLTIVPDENTRISLLRAGEADLIDVSINSVRELTKAGFKDFQRGLADTINIFFQPQLQGEATADVKVRQALSYAINRSEINKSILNGLGKPAGDWMATQEGHTPLPAIPYDLQKAQQLINETPFGAGGKQLTMQLQIPNRAGWPQLLTIGEAIQSYWKAIGVMSEIITGDYAAMRAKWLKRQLPSVAAICFNYPGSLAWLPNATSNLSCKGTLSCACDPMIENLLGSWAAATTVQDYSAAATDMAKYITEQAFTVPVVYGAIHYAGDDQIPTTYEPGRSGYAINLRGLASAS